MIVTQLVLAFCVGFSLAQEASDKKQALEIDGKDGAGLTSAEYDQSVSYLNNRGNASSQAQQEALLRIHNFKHIDPYHRFYMFHL